MLLISVHLYAQDTAALNKFEQEAVAVIRQYSGELIAAFKPANPENSADIPDEIHILQFPSQLAFDAYLKAPETATLAPKRTIAIQKTIVHISEEILNY